MADTDIIPIKNNGKQTYCRIQLHTGRFHQIRACLAYVGHPLVGDKKYGYQGNEKQYTLIANHLNIEKVDLSVTKTDFVLSQEIFIF